MIEVPSPQPPPRVPAAAICLALATLVLVGWRLGVKPLGDWDEALTGARSLGVLEHGRTLVVHFNGEPDYSKPPLYYWLAALLYAVAGVSELTTRLPGAIAAAGTTVLVFFLGRHIAGTTAGFFAAASWLTAPGVIGHVRQAQPDMVLFCAVLGGLYAFASEAYLTGGVAFAAGFLAKSLASFLLPVVTGLWALFAMDFRFVRRPRFWFGLALAIAIVSVWAAENWLVEREQFQLTFVGANRVLWTSPFGDTGAYYTSVARSVLVALPWAAALWPIAVVLRLRGGESWRAHALVPALAAGAVLALAISHPKNAHYVLIAALGLSLAAGVALATLAAHPSRWLKALVLIPVLVSLARVRGEPMGPVVLLVATGVLLAGAAWLSDVRLELVTAAWLASVTLVAAHAVGNVTADGRPNRALQLLAGEVQRLVPEDADVLFEGKDLQGAAFYARRHVEKVGGFFFREGSGPPVTYGLFRSGLHHGVAGYTDSVLAEQAGLRLVRLEREADAPPRGPRIITRRPDPATVNSLKLLGAETQVVEKNGFVDYVVLHRPPIATRTLPRDGWHLHAERLVGDPPSAIDGDPASHWTIAESQREGLAITVDLGEAETVSGIHMTTTIPRSFPNGLEAQSSLDGHTWEEIVSVGEFHPGYRWSGSGLDYSRDYAVEARFEPRPVRWLRLAVTAPRPDRPWSVSELEIFGAP